MKQKLSGKRSVPPSEGCRFSNLKTMALRLLIAMVLNLIPIMGFGQLAQQNFESGIPSTWAQGNNGVGTTPWTISSDGYMSSGAAFIDPSAENISSGNTASYYLITPQITVPANGQLRFYTKQSSLTDFGNVYQVRVSTASQTDINSFTTILASWTETQLNSTNPLAYEEKVVDIPSSIAPGLNIYVAFVLVNNQSGATPNADTWFVDNVGLQTAQVCDSVLAANFTATALTPTSATLSWIHPLATQFQIQVLPSGGTPAATGTATGNSYPAGSLTPGTAYHVYIKSLCSQSSSGWAGPFSFTTPALGTSCSTPIIIPATGAPFTYSANLNAFQNTAVTYPAQGANCLSPAVTGNYLNGAKAFFSYSPTQNGLLTVTQVTGAPGFNHITGVFVYEGCANVGVQCLAGINTSASGVAKKIPNLYVEASKTYIIVVSSSLIPSASITFTLKVETAQCAPPATFTYKNLLQDSVMFSWDNVANLSSAWEYKVQAAGAGAPIGAGTPTATNTDNLINSGLAAGTSYDLYVRSVCGGVPGAWSAPYRFATQCTVFPTPYSQNFTGTSTTVPAACWTAIDVNGDGAVWTYLSSAATMQTNTNQNYNHDYFITPQVNFNGTQKRLRFKHQTTNGTVKYSIKLSTTGVGVSNFTTVLMPETAINIASYQEKIINIPANITGNVNIAFIIEPGTGANATRISLDDVFIEDKPACPDPISPVASGMTTTSAQLSWTAGDAETQWQIVVQPKGTGLPAGTGVLVNTNSYSPSLTHATQYEYYVRAYCSSAQQSNWVGPTNFTTLCASFDTPFYESFNDADVATTHKFCWTTNNANADSAQWQVAATEARIQGGSFIPTTSYNDWLISPAINVVGTKELKFKYKAALSPFFPVPRFGVEVLMSTTNTDPASFSVVMPLMELTNTDYIEKSLYINANGPVYIAFRVPPTFSTTGGTSILQIDDVRIDEAPACPNPSALTASNITQTAAALAWTKGFMETQWEVKVQPAGTGLPTSVGTLTSNNTAYPVSSLIANTQYEYYVRAYCNSTDQSDWIGPFTFRTLCNAFTTPFTETFENSSLSEECWRVVNGNSDQFFWNLNMTTDPYEGEHAAAMFTGSNGANNDWLISPTVTIGPNQRLRYYYRVYDSFFEEDLEVLLSTNGNELGSFTTVLYSTDDDAAPLNNTVFKEKVINFPAGITGNINVAWHIPQKPANPAGYRGQLLVIDKVVIEDIPACPAPSNVSVQNITDTQAQVTWNSNSTGGTWEVYVQPAGMPAPAGAGQPQYNHAAASSPYTVNGLTAATAYDYYVRTICGTTGTSEWVAAGSFTTKCSFENLCEYTITLSNPLGGGISGDINLMQNEVLVQALHLTGTSAGASQQFTVFLCDGVEYSLYWDSIGWAAGTSAGALVTIQNQSGTTVWTSPSGLGTPKTTIYSGITVCSAIACPQPTNLSVNATGTLSWTAGGAEAQWEVFVQPVNSGTLPQSGTIVNAASYTPSSADFAAINTGTYEFFVRSVCDATHKSFWSGPHEFVRNDDASTAITLPVNTGEVCEQSVSKVSFMGATASTEAMTCTGANDGDIWFQFNAASKVHIIALDNFSGTYYYSGGTPPQPKITMTLYKVVGTALQQMSCTYNNVIVAAYASELEIGATYKVRLTLNGTAPNQHTFDVCVKTPEACELATVNSGFEHPDAVTGAINNFFTQQVVQGWRYNLPNWDASMYIDAVNAYGVAPYEGGQFIQMLSSDVAQIPGDLTNITGLYQDFDSSEITKFDYSFAHAGRSQGPVVQLFAGPPSGPFVLLEEHVSTMAWQLLSGTYTVPAGQGVTRFIFRSKDNAIGNLLDAASFIADNKIKTAPHTLPCGVTSTTLEAEGTGEWIADDNNPADVVIAAPNSRTTAITGFTLSGDYTFHWKTRYCDYTIVVTNIANDEIPAVTTPVVYCINSVAPPLTAPELTDYTLAWYTVPTGGTALTGAPTPDTSVTGTATYYVAYVAADGCEGARSQIDVVVTEKIDPVTLFSYDNEEYCTAAADPVISTGTGFTANGIFSAVPAGLAIDAATGAIDLSASATGNYQVTYTITATDCLNAGATTVDIVINQSVTPVTGFSYAASYCIAEANPLPSLDAGFHTGGIFTASAGMVIDGITGEIDLANTAPGTYDVTYSVAGQGCIEEGDTTVQVIVNALAVPVLAFAYESPACINSGNELVADLADDFVAGGIFSSQTLTVDAVTGTIDLTSATQGSHEVVYTLAVDAVLCTDGGTYTTVVELVNGITPVTQFNYEDAYCHDTVTATPQYGTGFTSGGVFSASEGLLIDASTGIIDVANSTPGSYIITYTIESDGSDCSTGGSFSDTVMISGSLEISVTQECRDNNVWLIVHPVNGSFDPASVSYTWKTEDGTVVGSGTAEFNVSEYYSANNSLEMPLDFEVVVASGLCSNNELFTVYSLMCEVQRGISPNGDGLNDSLDLTGFGVDTITIFNRYGKKVFSYGNGYTNQWQGQDNKGDNLPDGTYFYSIEKADGTNVTGWIYVNRQY